MTLLEKIDAVIEALYIHSDENPTIDSLEKWLIRDKIDKGEIQDCLLYLYRKKYIYCEYLGNRDSPYIDQAHAHYLISFKGKMFWEKIGGFVKKAENERIKLKNLDTLENIRRRNERLIVRGTIWLAVGTIALVLSEILINWKAIRGLFSGH